MNEQLLRKWEIEITDIIRTNIPTTEHNDCINHLDENRVYPPPCRDCIVWYFFQGHRTKTLKSIELLDKYIDNVGRILDVGTWISVIGYWFNMKCDMKTDSICIDCPDWELKDVEKHYQYNLAKHDITDKEKYDLVICSEMLSHFPGNIHNLIKQLVDACKAGGIIYISDTLGGIGKNLPKDIELTEYSNKQGCNFQLRSFKDNEIIDIMKTITNCQLLETCYVSTFSYEGKIQITIWRKT